MNTNSIITNNNYKYNSFIQLKYYCNEIHTENKPGKDMDMRTASRTGRLGLRTGLQYSEHIRFKLVTTMHNSQPNVSKT